MRIAGAGAAAAVGLLASGCGEAAQSDRAPPEPSPGDFTAPLVAWVEPGQGLQVRSGEDQAALDGWVPVSWLPNGDLWVRASGRSSGMAVYDPDTGEMIAETADELGAGDVGLDDITIDVLTSSVDSILVPGRLVGSPSTVEELDLELESTDSITLPEAPRGERVYATPVRPHDVLFVPYLDLVGGEVVADGVVRVEDDGSPSAVLEGRHVRELRMSSDFQSLLALYGDEPWAGDGEPSGAGPVGVAELDPMSGDQLRDLGRPDGLPESRWSVTRIDKVGDRVAVHVSSNCSDVSSARGSCAWSEQTWQNRGAGWEPAPGGENSEVYWQSPTQVVRRSVRWDPLTAAEYQRMVESGADLEHLEVSTRNEEPVIGPLEYVDGRAKVRLSGGDAELLTAPGALLRPGD
jgi:hypothetical protein